MGKKMGMWEKEEKWEFTRKMLILVSARILGTAISYKKWGEEGVAPAWRHTAPSGSHILPVAGSTQVPHLMVFLNDKLSPAVKNGDHKKRLQYLERQ